MREMRPLLLWVATALVALAIGDTVLFAPLAAALVATLIVVTASGPSTTARIVFAVAFLPTAFPAHAPTAVWVLAAALVCAATLLDRPSESGEAGLLRHLERARRRGEPASVMVLRVPSARRSLVRELQRRLRAADSSRVVRGVAADEIHAVMDGKELEAPAVEQRLGAGGIAFGWAHFPQDGGSLDVLLSTARERARGEDARSADATERAADLSKPLKSQGRLNNMLRLQGSAPLTRPSKVVVTGSAGFIGSHLAERLIAEGHEVLGIDCFTDFYPEPLKRANLARLVDEPRFQLLELDLSEDRLDGVLDGVSVVFHLAAQAGVRGSFGDTFATYSRHNIVATQRMLEQAASAPELERFVYASSSSVYGAALNFPTAETTDLRPVSPYGMTKVATEELAGVYHRTAGVPVTGLRFFTAYGPRQRPDMAFNRFIRMALEGEPIPVYGDGRQQRDFTFVDDVVDGTLAAAARGRAGSVYNIGGGRPIELREMITALGSMLGRQLAVRAHAAPVGEARVTAADGRLAREELGFEPRVSLEEGLAAQLAWMEREGEFGQTSVLAA